MIMPNANFKPYLANVPASDSLEPGLNGYDDTDGRPWQMVPVGGSRLLKIFVIGPGTEAWRIELDPPRPLVSGAREYPNIRSPQLENVHRIRAGQNPGSTAIIVRNSKGAEWGRLHIDVKKLRTVGVKFFLVSDKTGRKTSTEEAHVKEWVKYTNEHIF